MSIIFFKSSRGLVEEVVPLLSQDGGDDSPAAASHMFTANPRGVRRQNSQHVS